MELEYLHWDFFVLKKIFFKKSDAELQVENFEECICSAAKN